MRVDAIAEALSPSNAVNILRDYDIILDCCDNAATRYLINDTAVHLGKPLVSGAAEKLQGQLFLLNLGKDGPCRRCVFAAPPPPGSGSCEVSGILGVVTGTIGNLQALETINIITGLSGSWPL